MCHAGQGVGEAVTKPAHFTDIVIAMVTAVNEYGCICDNRQFLIYIMYPFYMKTYNEINHVVIITQHVMQCI